MTTETSKIKAKLAALSSSFDDLEALLEPLFSQTLPETVVGLEPLQQAKLQTLLPYLVYDLIFIYLKTKGIDPKSHPVISELDRIKQYFDKINNAENPPSKRTEIDKAAATRFIKHAIAEAKWKKTAAEFAQEEGEECLEGEASQPQATLTQVKVTSKMLQRAAYEKDLKASMEADEADDELEIFEDSEAGAGGADVMDVDEDSTRKQDKGKGKEQQFATVDNTMQGGSKRRRPMADPFAGYGDNTPPQTPKKAKSSKKSPKPDAQTALDFEHPASESPAPKISKGKKTKDKNRTKKSASTTLS